MFIKLPSFIHTPLVLEIGKEEKKFCTNRLVTGGRFSGRFDIKENEREKKFNSRNTRYNYITLYLDMGSIDKSILKKKDELEETSTSSGLKIDQMKNPHRIKLAPDEIKLIMFLIVEIKPFKYVGDRSLTQQRKWDLIRTKYYDAKSNNTDDEVIVPTVRTLQRQLTAGLKKAEARKKKKRIHDSTNQISDTERSIAERIGKLSVESATDQELEDMAYELNALSDYIKKMKSNPPSRPSSLQKIMNPSPESKPHKQQHRNSITSSSSDTNSTQKIPPPRVLQPPQPQSQPQPLALQPAQTQLQLQPQPVAPTLPQIHSFSPPLGQTSSVAPRILHDPQQSQMVHLLLQIVDELQTELESIVDRLRSIKQKLEKLK